MTGAESSTIAVVAVFGAPADLLDRVAELLGQVGAAILVDDGSGSFKDGVDYGISDLHIVSLPENGGIAHALNVGVERARDLGATAVVTLDQDSTVPDGYIRRALNAIAATDADGRRPGFAVPSSTGGNAILRGHRNDAAAPFDPIQSGAVFPMSVLDSVGPFEEQLFIDAVDSDYTLRVRGAGYEVLPVEGVDLGHALGELVPIKFGRRQLVIAGKPRHVLYHAPFRTYYMVRNSIFLMQSHGTGNVRWHLRRTRKLGSMIASAIVLGSDRSAQVRAATLGMLDALQHRYGKITPSTRARIERRSHGRDRSQMDSSSSVGVTKATPKETEK